MILHPWHAIPLGKDAPNSINAIIEIQRGSKAKYELDKETGLLRLDRILLTDLTYPVHYGLIPQTYCEDEDPLDIIMLCSEQLIPLSIVEGTVLGAMRMIDGGQQDDKIIAVATHDRTMNHQDLDDLPEQTLASIKHFFHNYKKQEQKEVVIERFFSKEDAHKIILEAMQAYQQKFKKSNK